MKNVRLLPSNPANAVSAVLFGGVLGSLLGPGALAQVEQWEMLGVIQVLRTDPVEPARKLLQQIYIHPN